MRVADGLVTRRGTPLRSVALLGLRSSRLVIVGGCFASALQVNAAGGHHAVDDAEILDSGQCQIETWQDRQAMGPRHALLHMGGACRVGPVEVGVNMDRTRADADGSVTSGGPQLKWAMALDDRWSVGVLATSTWKSRASRYDGSSIVVPVSWHATDALAVHANIGRDFRPGARDQTRSGLSVEWQALPTVSVVAERFRESQENRVRLGLRWTPTPAINIDLSQARGLRRSEPAWWTLGVTYVFSRWGAAISARALR